MSTDTEKKRAKEKEEKEEIAKLKSLHEEKHRKNGESNCRIIGMLAGVFNVTASKENQETIVNFFLDLLEDPATIEPVWDNVRGFFLKTRNLVTKEKRKIILIAFRERKKRYKKKGFPRQGIPFKQLFKELKKKKALKKIKKKPLEVLL